MIYHQQKKLILDRSSACTLQWLLVAASAFAALALTARQATAQDAGGNAALPGTASALPANATGLSLPASPFEGAEEQSDLVFGRNTKGPYPLSWKNIRPETEQVYRNGDLLKRDTDYTLDAATGALAFAAPLKSDEVVRITYRHDMSDSAPNKNAIIVPVALDMWRRGQNHLTLRSRYRPDDDNALARNESLDSALQWTGGTKLGTTSQFASGLYVDLHGGDWLGRSGLFLSDQTKLGLGQITLNYKRAGAQFGQADVKDTLGIDKGREIMDASGAFNPLRRLAFNTSFRQTTELPDATGSGANGETPKGTTTREQINGVTYALPRDLARIEASRGQTVTVPGDSTQTLRTTDTVKVDSKLPTGTQASVGYHAVAVNARNADGTEKKDGATYDQTTSVEVKQRVAGDALSVQGTFQNQVGTSGGQDAAGLKIEAAPFAASRKGVARGLRDLKLSANWNDRFQDSGVTRNREARVELPTLPVAQAQLSGGVRETSVPGKDRLVGLVDGKAKPFRYLELTGGARLRDGEGMTTDSSGQTAPDLYNTYNAKMTLAPIRTFRLTSSYSRNPEDDSGTIKQSELQLFGLETQLGILTLRGQYGTENQYLQTRMANAMDVSLDLHLTHQDTLTTGYQSKWTFDKDNLATTIYQLQFTHKLGTLFDFSLNGAMTQYGQNGVIAGDKTEIKAGAKLGLKF